MTEDSESEPEEAQPVEAPDVLAASSPSDAAAPWTFVQNGISGYTHRVLVGPPSLPATEWLAACGWKFGASAKAAPVRFVGIACSKCFARGAAPKLEPP